MKPMPQHKGENKEFRLDIQDREKNYLPSICHITRTARNCEEQ